jgi:hypothetical protein
MSSRIYGMYLQDSIVKLLLAHKSLHNSLIGSKEVHCLEKVIHIWVLD